jgi:hypothetical protein
MHSGKLFKVADLGTFILTTLDSLNKSSIMKVERCG